MRGRAVPLADSPTEGGSPRPPACNSFDDALRRKRRSSAAGPSVLVHDIVRINARKRPHAEALIFDDGTRRTWLEFYERSGRIASALATFGVRPGDRVAVLGRNSLETIEMYIACSRIGALFAPINYRFTVPEIQYVLNDCGAKVVLSEVMYADTVDRLREEPTDSPPGAWVSFRGEIAGTENLES